MFKTLTSSLSTLKKSFTSMLFWLKFPSKEKYVTIPVTEDVESCWVSLNLLVEIPMTWGPSKNEEVVESPEIFKTSLLINPRFPV